MPCHKHSSTAAAAAQQRAADEADPIVLGPSSPSLGLVSPHPVITALLWFVCYYSMAPTAAQVPLHLLLQPMAAVVAARCVVFVLSGKRKASLSFLPAKQTVTSEDNTITQQQQQQQQQQQPQLNGRKRRRGGLRARRAGFSDQQPSSPPPAEPPPPPPLPLDTQTERPLDTSTSHSPSSSSSLPPSSPPPLSPPAAVPSTAAGLPLSPVFSLCDDSSEPPSPVYDYSTVQPEQRLHEQAETDDGRQEELSNAAAAVCEPSAPIAEEVTLIENRSSPPLHNGHQPPPQPSSKAYAAAAAPAAADGDGDVLVLGETAAASTADSFVDDDIVTLLIDGRHERIHRSRQSHSLGAFQPMPLSATSASASASALTVSSNPSSFSRRRARHQQLTFNSDLSLNAARSSAPSVANSTVYVDAAVAGRVPALFQPRSRDIQRRITDSAAAGSAKKRPAVATSDKASSSDSGRLSGKKRAMQPSTNSPRSSTSSHAPGANVASGEQQSEDANRSRFGDCPLCGEVSPSTHVARTRMHAPPVQSFTISLPLRLLCLSVSACVDSDAARQCGVQPKASLPSTPASPCNRATRCHRR